MVIDDAEHSLHPTGGIWAILRTLCMLTACAITTGIPPAGELYRSAVTLAVL